LDSPNPKRSSATIATLCLCLSLGALACGDATSLDLLLTPDPNVTNSDELAKELGSVTVVIDSSKGLYPNGPPSPVNGIELRDEDNDGQLEVIALVDTMHLDRLPLIRLERGTLPDESIELRISGKDRQGNRIFAAGGLKGAKFVADKITDMVVPFNIKLRYRAPVVTQTIPFSGSTHAPGSTSSIFAIFSKKMNVDSVRKAITLVRVEDKKEIPVPAEFIRVQYIANNDESPTSAEYRLKEALDGGRYRLRISTNAVDSAGLALDQVPLENGSQPFSGQFEIDGTAMATTPAMASCAQGGDQCSSGTTCDKNAQKCEAAACPDKCPAATVCSLAWNICVPDCRVFGGFGGCDKDETCNPAGICE